MLHNLLLNYNDTIPQEWYDNLAEKIDFSQANEIENLMYVRATRGEEQHKCFPYDSRAIWIRNRKKRVGVKVGIIFQKHCTSLVA